MATYREIVKDVLINENRWVHTCWVAHVKEMNGLNPRRAPNRFPKATRVNPCPAWARPLIEKAMKRLGMLWESKSPSGDRTRW